MHKLDIELLELENKVLKTEIEALKFQNRFLRKENKALTKAVENNNHVIVECRCTDAKPSFAAKKGYWKFG